MPVSAMPIAQHVAVAGVRERRWRVSPVVVMIPPMAGSRRKIKPKDIPTVAQALAYAIEAIDMLPPNWQTGIQY
jgi:hypothetical protein